MFIRNISISIPLTLILLLRLSCGASVEKKEDADSYIDALQKTQNEDSIGLHGDLRHSSSIDNNLNLHPGYSYGPPTIEYGPSSISYPSNFAPYPSYGPPGHSSYGPPKPTFSYGPPVKYPVVHSAPRDEHWLLDKFKFKLDLFTIGKILIKLIIFKKIVKFIALIGLLLFLPKLQTKHMNFMDLLGGGDDSEEETETNETTEKRSLDYSGSRQRQINEVSKFARTAIESFTEKYLSKCGNLSDIPCRFQTMVDQIDDKYPYERIFEMFVPLHQHRSKKPIRFSHKTASNLPNDELHENSQRDMGMTSTASTLIAHENSVALLFIGILCNYVKCKTPVA